MRKLQLAVSYKCSTVFTTKQSHLFKIPKCWGEVKLFIRLRNVWHLALKSEVRAGHPKGN